MKSVLHSIGLRYFVEVARTGSVSAASEALHVDISAISRQISKLEQELRCILFDRLPRGMVLTEGGRKLMSFAVRSLLDAEQIGRELQEVSDFRGRTLRIASSHGFAYEALPEAIASFSLDHPGISFDAYVGLPMDISERVRDGEADIGLTFTLSPISGVRTEFRQPSPIHVLVRHDDKLAGRKALSLKALEGRDVLVPGKGATLRELIDISAGVAGVTLNPVMESDNGQLLYRIAQMTGALLFTSMISVSRRYRSDGFVAIPLTDRILRQRSVELQTMAGRNLPPPVRKFCDHLAKALNRPYSAERH
ncbi:hypothetical protein ASE00_13015 [Sphingomonas sp. Root710]|uniref:LysR family transcriptional regulator n=1 Tax=Sphingomonas sp. Root710 TaxID=1736594 RepID=UPI0006F7CB79|nr:LysR family transcriptional regulator [Sphingomonas sp. Root710]KRB82915.1 hypothetical protein ASE00_13015 [Sphingomonas sp. Root710]